MHWNRHLLPGLFLVFVCFTGACSVTSWRGDEVPNLSWMHSAVEVNPVVEDGIPGVRVRCEWPELSEGCWIRYRLFVADLREDISLLKGIFTQHPSHLLAAEDDHGNGVHLRGHDPSDGITGTRA